MNPTTNRPSPTERHERSFLPLPLIGVAVAALFALVSCSSDASDGSAATGSTSTASTDTTAAPSTTAPASSTTTEAAATTSRPSWRRDDEVTVGGVSVHLACDGTGPSTVVLIAGFEADSTSWSAVAPDVEGSARVCTYDRPGLGASSPATGVTTFDGQANLLHDVLAAAGEPGPYVLVGHSFGGLEALEFTRRFRAEVEGIVLVDTTPIDWPTALCEVTDDGSVAASVLRSLCTSWDDPTANQELLDVWAAFRDLAGLGSFGSLPIEIITAAERTLPEGISDAERARLDHAWDVGQELLADLSSFTRLTTVDGTGHHIELERPDVVVAAIDRLLP